MVGSELGDEVGGVLCGIDGEGLGDDEEGGSEFGDGELLTRALQEGRVEWRKGATEISSVKEVTLHETV